MLYSHIFIAGLLSRTTMGNPAVFVNKMTGSVFPGILPNCVILKDTGLTDNVIVLKDNDIPPETYQVSSNYHIHFCKHYC